jgi:hypothetical protein
MSKEEEDKRLEAFEATRLVKNKELEAVISFLRDKVGLKSHKAIFM